MFLIKEYAGHSVWHLVCLAGSCVCSILSLANDSQVLPLSSKSQLDFYSVLFCLSLFFCLSFWIDPGFHLCVVFSFDWFVTVNNVWVKVNLAKRLIFCLLNSVLGDSFLFLPWLPRSCYSFYSLSRSQIALHATFVHCRKYVCPCMYVYVYVYIHAYILVYMYNEHVYINTHCSLPPLCNLTSKQSEIWL